MFLKIEKNSTGENVYFSGTLKNGTRPWRSVGLKPNVMQESFFIAFKIIARLGNFETSLTRRKWLRNTGCKSTGAAAIPQKAKEIGQYWNAGTPSLDSAAWHLLNFLTNYFSHYINMGHISTFEMPGNLLIT